MAHIETTYKLDKLESYGFTATSSKFLELYQTSPSLHGLVYRLGKPNAERLHYYDRIVDTLETINSPTLRKIFMAKAANAISEFGYSSPYHTHILYDVPANTSDHIPVHSIDKVMCKIESSLEELEYAEVLDLSLLSGKYEVVWWA